LIDFDQKNHYHTVKFKVGFIMDNALQVIMTNEMIRAAHNLKLQEKRVLMLAIAKLEKDHFKNSNAVIRLQVSELQHVFGMDSKSVYREAKKAVRGIRKRYLRFYEVYKNKKYETDISWTTKATYADSEGWIELSLNKDLELGLLDLKGHFTQYQLGRAAALRSLYAWRLFELLMQFKKTGFLKILLDEFHDTMESTDSYKKDFSLLRTRVIEPAVKEICEKDGLKVKWEAIKTGRKVTALKFTFPVEQQTALPLLDSKPAPKPTKQQEDKEKAADLAHLKKLAELAGVPVETLTKRS
jgi:plasmid replication initiation protein